MKIGKKKEKRILSFALGNDWLSNFVTTTELDSIWVQMDEVQQPITNIKFNN